MKFFSKINKIVSLILVPVLLIGSGVLPAFAEQDEDISSEQSAGYYKGVYAYRSDPGNGDSFDIYVYSDDYFRTPSSEYNIHLASMSMAVAQASFGSAREADTTAGYARKSRNLTALLEDIGFSGITVNAAYRAKPTADSAGVACAHKQIISGGNSCTLLAVMPRSQGYEAELGSNFLVGSKGNASGSDTASEKILSFVRQYIVDNALEGDIKVWMAGYDRGAAIVNLTAKKLIDDPGKNLGTAVSLLPEDLYAYTFAMPSAADSKQHPDSEKYGIIYNHIVDTDVFTLLPPAELGLGRYGTDILLNTKDKKSRMKQLFKICNPELYDEYINGMNPEAFSPMRTTSSLSIVKDTGSYIPSDVREYLKGMSRYIAQFSGGRTGYSGSMEKPVFNILSYYGSLSGNQAEAFVNALSNDKDTINGIFCLYAYFVRANAKGTAAASAQAPTEEQAIAPVAALTDASSEFSEKDLYDLMLRMIRYMRSSPDTILSDAAKYLKTVLTSAMQASGATSSKISSLTGTSDMKALSRFLSYLLFGNIWQSGEIDPYDLSNQQIRSAVTLLSNAELLISDHMSERLISWLRAADSYYDDYAAVTEAQATGYRRVYLSASDSAVLNGDICNAAGEKVAEIRGGALISSADAWIGYTAADDGGFLRIPMDGDYRIALTADAACLVDVTIGEYDCRSAQTATALTGTYAVPSEGVLTVNLPSPAEGFAIPSGTAYAVSVMTPDPLPEPVTEPVTEPVRLLGDADTDDAVTILDATAIQRYLAGIAVEIDMDAANVDGEDGVSILDATYIQRWLANLSCPDGIGNPIKSVPETE